MTPPFRTFAELTDWATPPVSLRRMMRASSVVIDLARGIRRAVALTTPTQGSDVLTLDQRPDPAAIAAAHLAIRSLQPEAVAVAYRKAERLALVLEDRIARASRIDNTERDIARLKQDALRRVIDAFVGHLQHWIDSK